MFFGGELNGSSLGSRPINHADVLVRVADAMDVEKTRRDERARAGRGRGRALTNQFNVESAFLFRLAERGTVRIFVQFDVPAERQPLAELAMMDAQNFRVVNDENCDGEINFFVDVRHK